MELVIAVALGAWIAFGGWISYRSIKKEFQGHNADRSDKGKQT